jgi:hypothetical protein
MKDCPERDGRRLRSIYESVCASRLTAGRAVKRIASSESNRGHHDFQFFFSESKPENMPICR